MATGFAVRGGKAGADDKREKADTGLELRRGHLDRGQVVGERAFLEVLRAVSAACSAASRPCSMAVISVARIFFTALISEPPSADSRAISSIGSVV